MSALVAGQQEVAEATPDPAARVRALADDYVNFALKRPHVFAAIYDPTICVPGSPTPTMAPLIEQQEQILAQAAGELNPGSSPEQVATLAAAMWGAAHGLAELGRAGHLPPSACSAAVALLFADPLVLANPLLFTNPTWAGDASPAGAR